MSNKRGLTAKQERFCYEYCQDYNATQAAIRAGYSKKTAGAIGGENLQKPEIKDKISEIKKKLIEEAKVTPQMIIEEYTRIAFSDITDYLKFGSTGVWLKDSEGLDKKKTAALESVKEGKDGISLKMHSKLAALNKLAEYHELMKRPEVESDLDIEVIFDE